MKKIVIGVIAAITVAGVFGTSMALAHNPGTCFCDQYGCVCQ